MLVTRKVELTHVVGTLEDLCYVNPKEVVGPFGVSLVLEKAVVKKAIMEFMPKCQTTLAGFEVPYQSSETMPQKNATINLHSVNSCDHTFFKERQLFSDLIYHEFIQQAKSK